MGAGVLPRYRPAAAVLTPSRTLALRTTLLSMFTKCGKRDEGIHCFARTSNGWLAP